MKIGVNARFLTKPFTGIGQYTKNLVKQLALMSEADEYILIVPEPLEPKATKGFGKNITVKVLPEKGLGGAGAKKTYWEQKQVPKLLLSLGVEVAFFPYPSNPWNAGFYNGNVRTIVTVHDTIPWEDRRYTRGILSRVYQARVRDAVKRADVVLTVSGASMEDTVRVCGVEKSKIEVVYNDAGEAYKEHVDGKFAAEVLHRLGLREQGYFLYVGGYDARKNVTRLVEAFKGFKMPLVMVGARLFENKLYKSFESNGSGNIVRTGFIEEDNLAALYNKCRAFVNISEKEGFNIPILEAANQGAPLVLSDIPVHREVAEDKAYFVESADVASVRKGLEVMLNDSVRDNYAEMAKALAKKYSWKKYAGIVFNIIHGRK